MVASCARRSMSAGDACWRQSARTGVAINSTAIAAPLTALRIDSPIGLLLAVRFLAIFMALWRRPHLQIRGRRHAGHVEARVDEMHCAGDATCQVGKQIQCRALHMVKLD